MIEVSEITRVTNLIVQFFNPERIILFGSYAYGNPTEYSDIDLSRIIH